MTNNDLSPGQTILGHVKETSASSEVIALYKVENYCVKYSTLHPSVYLHQFKYTWLKRNADVVFDFDQTIFI